MLPIRTLLTLLICAGSCSALADSDPGQELRRFFEGIDAGAAPVVAGRRLNHPALLSQFYRDREHLPLWTRGGALERQLATLLTAIESSAAHGLNGADYHLGTLHDTSAADRTAAELELLATDAFLTQVRHRASGAVSPRELDPEWHMIKPEVDALETLRLAAGSGIAVDTLLDELWPQSEEYRDLVEHRARILALGEVQAVRVPTGGLLKPGQSDQRVAALKNRLLGPGDHGSTFDQELRAAVVEFQRSAGLEADGIVGDATLEVMNASRFSWIDRLDANLERWRWLPREQPDTYVRVNIAAYSLRVIRAGEEALRMDVIVGRPYRRTPVFTESIKYLVLNPFWNVPYQLAVQDKLPVLKRDSAELAAQGFEVRPEGADAFQSVTSVDWSTVERGNFRYLLRQRPGPANALGQVKFMLPNPHSVYLHDTPSRELFARQERSFSSGCVRLSRPLDLAAWILQNDGRPKDAQRVTDLVASGETTTLYLKTPLPTWLVYFTAFTDVAGEVVFRRDLYQRDAALVAALRNASST